MLIYHKFDTSSKTDGVSKNIGKRVKKEYKGIDNRKHDIILAKALDEEVQKKSKKQKKKISKKNIQFLEGLGLKVK